MLFSLFVALGPTRAEAPETASLRIAFLGMPEAPRATFSDLEPEPLDLGLQGARLAIQDNNTTGQFLGQSFHLEESLLSREDDPTVAFRDLVAKGARYVVTRLPADALLKIADLPEARETLLFNAGAPDDRLRNAACRSNVMHTLPSRAMLADALAQYLVRKRWPRWFLVVGPQEGDRRFADAVRRAAGRFGGRIVEEKNWTYTHDARRTAESEVPVFTQGPAYDVLIVADESGDFGEHFAYRTWEPRPVAGTQGLTPLAWHRAHEQWGAAQLQRRFQALAGRAMRPLDYAAWLAVRAIGEAATQTQQTASLKVTRDHLLGPGFALQGFKGRKLNFRPWDHELRQPILLASPNAVVSASPQEGFLHPKTTLDTLGYDEPESGCRLSGH